MILVSACLLGLNVRYDGGSARQELLCHYAQTGAVIPVCPEQLGGLPTPRMPAEIQGGSGKEVISGSARVAGCDGGDVTIPFVKGAREVLQITRLFPVTGAILKERSPSCGVHRIYDGTFDSRLQAGEGVLAYLLKQLPIPVYSEEEVTEELLRQLAGR